jgi:hypothetical protein
VDPHSGRALHERLDDERCERGPVLGERALRLVDRCGQRASSSIPRSHRNTCGGVRRTAGAIASATKAMERFRVPDADRAERVTVIPLHQRRESRPKRVTAELMVLERDPQRRLDGRCAGVE